MLTEKQKYYLILLFRNINIHFKFNKFWIDYKSLNNKKRIPIDNLLKNNYIILHKNKLVPNFNNIQVKKQYNDYILKSNSDYYCKHVDYLDMKSNIFPNNEENNMFQYTTFRSLKDIHNHDKVGDKYLAIFDKNTNEIVGIVKYGYYLNSGNYIYKDRYIYELVYINVRKDKKQLGISNLLLVYLNKNISNLSYFTTTTISSEGRQSKLDERIHKIMYNRYINHFNIEEFIRNPEVKKVKAQPKFY